MLLEGKNDASGQEGPPDREGLRRFLVVAYMEASGESLHKLFIA
jgi:hypothetical protein